MNLRQQRVRELLKREAGEAIRREFPIEDVGLLTVNEVGVAADLKSATIFVGVIGTPAQRKHAVAALEKDAKRLQGMVGRAVVLKYTPHLKFVIDESIERGNRVLEILEDIERDSPGNEGSPQGR